eukprot:s2492_g4.t1
MDGNPGPSKKKRKGGIHQRLQAAEEDMSVDSCLFGLLMVMFAKGILSGHQVHSLAKAGQEDINKAHDGFQVKKLNRLAQLQQSKNLGRTVSTMMTKNTELPMPMEVHVPMKGLPEGQTCKSIMLPHEIFSAFYDNGAAWSKCILPDSSKLQDFWSSFSGHPCFEGHPLKTQPDYSTCVIPLGLHGDEVPVLGVGKIWCKCVLFFSWFSLMSVAAGQQFQDSNLYIWGIFEKYAIPTQNGILGTMDTFFAIMKWSFQCIYEGTFPTLDWRGKPFPRNSKEYQKAGQPLAGKLPVTLVVVSLCFALSVEEPLETDGEDRKVWTLGVGADRDRRAPAETRDGGVLDRNRRATWTTDDLDEAGAGADLQPP